MEGVIDDIFRGHTLLHIIYSQLIIVIAFSSIVCTTSDRFDLFSDTGGRLQNGNSLICLLNFILVLLRCVIVASHVNLNVLAFYLLHRSLQIDVMLPILVELRETSPNIVDKELGQLLIRFDHEAEELTMIIVHYVAKLFLERKWLKVFPCEVLGFEDEDAILELVDFLRLSRHKFFIFL